MIFAIMMFIFTSAIGPIRKRVRDSPAYINENMNINLCKVLNVKVNDSPQMSGGHVLKHTLMDYVESHYLVSDLT